MLQPPDYPLTYTCFNLQTTASPTRASTTKLPLTYTCFKHQTAASPTRASTFTLYSLTYTCFNPHAIQPHLQTLLAREYSLTYRCFHVHTNVNISPVQQNSFFEHANQYHVPPSYANTNPVQLLEPNWCKTIPKTSARQRSCTHLCQKQLTRFFNTY